MKVRNFGIIESDLSYSGTFLQTNIKMHRILSIGLYQVYNLPIGKKKLSKIETLLFI